MKRLLRGCIDFGNTGQESLIFNFQKLRPSKIQWGSTIDEKIFKFICDFFAKELTLPSIRTLVDVYKVDDEAIERLKDIKGAALYEGANFSFVLKGILEEQNRFQLLSVLKDTQEIAHKGLLVGEGKNKQRLQGVKEAVIHFQRQAADLIIPDHNSKIRGDLREAAPEAWADYQAIKADPERAWGAHCGIPAIDDICRGVKKGELWIHAAFTGELKCLPGDAWVYDHAQRRKRTLKEIMVSQEMPMLTVMWKEGKIPRLLRGRASGIASNGVRLVSDLILASGRTVGATGNHLFWVLGQQQVPKWKKLDDLEPGDYVAVPKLHEVRRGRGGYRTADVGLVACLLGAGSFETFKFEASHQKLEAAFTKYLRVLGYKPSTLSTGPFRFMVEELGLLGVPSANVFIPHRFFGLPEVEVRYLLGVLWSSCNPSLDDMTKFKFSHVSHQLCLDMQSLFLQLGVTTVVLPPAVRNGDGLSSVRVSNAYSKRLFVELIKVIGREEFYEALVKDLPDIDDRQIPVAFVEKGIEVEHKYGFVKSNRVLEPSRQQKTISRSLAESFAAAPESDRLRRDLEGDLEWDLVVDVVERGLEETFDMEVPEHHTFVVNDIVTHNTALALNWCYHLVTTCRRNAFFVSLEMPFRQLRNMLCVLHSANLRFGGKGKSPLDYRRVRDGELTPEEETFYQEVLYDFENNPENCRLELWCPDHDVTIADIKMEAEMLYRQMDIGMLCIDHGLLVTPVRHYTEYNIGANSIIRDSKKLALHFNQGEGLPVLLLYQINRQGKREAEKNDRRYSLAALSHANEAERSADVVTTTYLDDELRLAGRTVVQCLKNRDNPFFRTFQAAVDFSCRRIVEAQNADENSHDGDEHMTGV